MEGTSSVSNCLQIVLSFQHLSWDQVSLPGVSDLANLTQTQNTNPSSGFWFTNYVFIYQFVNFVVFLSIGRYKLKKKAPKLDFIMEIAK